MQRFKNMTAVLLSLTLVAAMAFLPWIIADLQEQQSTGDVSYANINEVTLNIDSNTLWDTLALVSGYDLDSYQIDGNKARLTIDEVRAIAVDTMTTYQDSGLFVQSIPSFAGNDVEITPLLVYPSIDPANNCIMWGVTTYTETTVAYDAAETNPALWNLTLLIDDSTGKVLSIDYHDPNIPFGGSDLYEILFQFYHLYFAGLGAPLSVIAEEQYAANGFHHSDYSVSTEFYVKDPESGSIHLTFEVNPYGFSCYTVTS